MADMYLRELGHEMERIRAGLLSMTQHEITTICRAEFVPLARHAVTQIRRNIRAIPNKEGHAVLAPPIVGEHTGLRLRLENAVSMSVHTFRGVLGVAVYMDTRKMPSGQYALPMEMEGRKRWRHPLFGNRSYWYDQGPHPYFFPETSHVTVESAAAMEAALRIMRARISGHRLERVI